MIKKFLVAAALCLATLPAVAETYDADIKINNKIRYQHVSGFGGFSPSPTWQYWLSANEMRKLFGNGEDELGLNILRMYMANSRSAWSAGVSNAKIAQRYGAFIFASPWSPPGSWKTNNSDSKGGELLESRYADWAKLLNDYYKYMKDQGVTIHAVSVQNEPDWRADYQSCIWSGEQMAKFLRECGHLIECKIIAPEAIHFTRSMHEPILNDPEACARLDILGGHFYGWDGSSYPLAAQKGKEVWMTEYLINERQQNQGLDINWKDDGFLFARSINDAMLANMSAWVHYSLKRYYGCLGDGTYGTVDNEITKRGYILSHYAKYVSGTTRIRHNTEEPTGQLSTSAYISEGGDSIVMMLINPAEHTYSTSITLPFNTLQCRQIVTTETVNMQKATLTYPEETYMPMVEVEPYSVSTYIFVRSSDRVTGADTEEEGTVVFTDDFDLFGGGCVPEGWTARSDEGVRTAGAYTMGPRIMSFSAEGVMTHAFYFRSVGKSNGYITYGSDADYPLWLEPGAYTLHFSTVGWKGTPAVTATVMKSGSRNGDTVSVIPEVAVEDNGPSSRITSTTDGALEFAVAEGANYILRWHIPAGTDGMNEVLVGGIRLVRHDADGIESVLIDSDIAAPAIYDLTGRKVLTPTTPGIYITRGHKIIIR